MVRLRALPLLLLLALSSGCTHYRDVNSAESLATVNTESQTHTTAIRLVSGEFSYVRGLRMASDSTTWVNPKTDRLVSVPTTAVRAVVITDRRRGGRKGLGRGFLIFGGIGAAGVGHSCRGEEVFISCEPGEGALLGALLFGIPGSLISGLVGLAVGDRTIYSVPADVDLR